ncbi:hypothetical protein GUJ93_ZPchr0004g39529 [Zizania palustris]|uniref:Uncharacterized protein n=1 Tax=Zizania palustris TaxID=103762 RepID=A0A8J5SQ49_ZIZPA|nr:hypothetical protein GUJ93_ZPchr0004g39529 [Zizania palustris]
MSPPTSLKDSRINWSEPVPSTANFRTVEERVSGSSIQETKLTPLARVGEQLSEKPFCCTCRESISMESQLHHQSATPRSMPIFTGRQVPQLNIDYMSPSLQTQLPSPSNPILRLMGKNLMVMNSEESGHPQAPSSDYIMGGNYMQPVSFVPQNYQHNGDSAFMNTTTSTANHQIPQSSVQGGNFVGPHCPVVPWCNLITISTKALQKPCSSNASLILLDERSIMINDSPEHRSNPQVSMFLPAAPSPSTISVPNTVTSRPFYCVPSQNQILPRESAVGSLPLFSNISPMVSVSSSSQGSKVEVPHPYMPNPFYVQSPAGYINPSVYYSPNLR